MLHESFTQFIFKGNRSYAHGSDIFDAVIRLTLDYFGQYPSELKGSFHSLLNCHGKFQIYDDIKEIESITSLANFTLLIKNTTYYITLTDSNVAIDKKRSYSEEEILNGMIIKNNRIQLKTKKEFSYIEQIVAMTKKLHLDLYHDAKGKWLFTKIEIEGILDPQHYLGNNLEIEANKNFLNKLTQNFIFLRDKKIGNIWFSTV